MIIGSTALKYYFPDFPRDPKDIDYCVETKSDIKSTRDVEYLVNPVFYKYVAENTLDVKGMPTIDMLYTLKLSHMFWDINWKKHIYDIEWLKDKGCIVIESLFYDLYEYWNSYHSKNTRSDLKMTGKEFFDNAVVCEYDHDWLHTLITPNPTYKKVLKDGAEVDVSKDKFNALSFQEKCDLVKEEVYVMAYERMPKLNYKIAYERMLQKFILSHAPLWEALFILDNFKDLYKPTINYTKTIENGIKFKTN